MAEGGIRDWVVGPGASQRGGEVTCEKHLAQARAGAWSLTGDLGQQASPQVDRERGGSSEAQRWTFVLTGE